MRKGGGQVKFDADSWCMGGSRDARVASLMGLTEQEVAFEAVEALYQAASQFKPAAGVSAVDAFLREFERGIRQMVS